MSRFPEDKDQLPKRGNWLGRVISRTVYRLAGWRVTGELPNQSKIVVVAGPHTSNWDGVLAVFTLFALDLKASFFVKDDIFVVPFKRALHWVGAFPVNRRNPRGLLGQVHEQFESQDRMWLCITPEGTRSKVNEWKTGFYRIAVEVGVPILPLRVDFVDRTLQLGELFEPTGDMDADVEILRAWVSEGRGRHRNLE